MIENKIPVSSVGQFMERVEVPRHVELDTVGHGKNGNDVSVFCRIECRTERVFFTAKEMLKTVLIERVRMRGDVFVGSKVGATRRAQRGNWNVIVSKGPWEAKGKNWNDVSRHASL